MTPNSKVAFYTLGCKLNFSETSAIARTFEKKGYARVEFEDRADVYVINTCSVTQSANSKCRNIVRRALKFNPDAYIAVIGCYAQLKPKEISEIEGVDIVLGANEKFNLPDHIHSFKKNEETKILNGKIKEVKTFVPSYSFGERTRSFLKVQDGCNYFCAFCTIPLARGRSRSSTVVEVVKQAEELASNEIKEIVLTGVNIGDFKNDLGENFFDVVKALDKVKGIERFRISSIEPNLLSKEIIDFVAQSEKFVPHFHIPLQSGSNKILKLMRRRYDSGLYKRRIEYIKKLMPNCCIGVDVIVGFPSESDEDFNQTLSFIKSLDISYLHVFTYSERENTTALRIKEVVPMEVRHKRSKQLQILSEKKRRYFYNRFLGQEMEVLLESENHDGFLNGFTDNYIKVVVPYDKNICDSIHRIKLDTINFEGKVNAQLIQEPA